MGFFKNKKNEELVKREDEVAARENKVTVKEEKLEQAKDLLEQRKAEFEERQSEVIETIQNEFSKLENERTVFEKKRTEYEPKFQEALEGFAARTKENEADIQKRISDHAENLLHEQKKFAEKLHEAHQESEREHEALLLAQTKERLKQTDEELSQRRNDIAEKEAAIREREIELQNDRNALTQDRKDYEQKDTYLTAEREIVSSKSAALDEQAQELADAKIKEAEARLKNYKAEHERLCKERAGLERQLVAYEEIKSRLGEEEPGIILTKMESLTRQLADAKEKLAGLPDDVEKELNKKQDEIESLQKQLDDLRRKFLDSQMLANSSEITEVNNASLETKNNILEHDNNRLELLVAKQSETIKQFTELFDKEASREEKLQSIMAPHENFTEEKILKEPLELIEKENEETETVTEEIPNAPTENIADAENQTEASGEVKTETSDETVLAAPDKEKSETSENKPQWNIENDEMIWLDMVSKKISDYGLEFSPRIIKAFHTALKTAEWSPLAVLAGVSGTGKSELPQLYAKFGGINFINVPVQPNWDSQESLLGYYNTISAKFEAQPLLKFLVQTQNEKSENYNLSLKNQMNIVLLDEMNLAHIEQYFAEFLSKLEERRGKKESDSQFPTLSVKLGGIDSYPLKLGRNVLWVGTMNQDETTKSLSDKVLDRGIVINFPRPESFKRRTNVNRAVQASERYLPVETWNSWKVVFNNDLIKASESVIAPYKELVENINKLISNIGRAIGHRVWQSIENYIWNYPDVRQLLISQSADMNDSDFTQELCTKMEDADFKCELFKKIDTAFEDQLVQKIMPKLRGIETRGESKKVLENISQSIEQFKSEGHAINISKDFENAVRFGDGQFLWVTSEYLHEKAEDK